AGDPEEAARLLRFLEMYSMLEKLGLSSIAKPKQVQEQMQMGLFDELPTQQTPQAALAPLTTHLTGRVELAPMPDGWLVVQGSEAYTASADNKEFLALLRDAATEKRCYDSKPLYTLCADAQNITFDALLAAYLLNPASRGYDLMHLASQYGAVPSFPCEEQRAPLLAPLFDALENACEEQSMTMLLREIEQPLAPVLAEMERAGILVDEEGITQFGTELRRALDAELGEIYSMVGYEFNVNSPKQLGKALFEDLGLATRKKNKSGFSTNAETLEALREEHPVISHVLLYRTYQKLNSTYIEGLLKVIGEDGRIHSTFNQTETRTGRISSGEPNLQNIPVRTELGSRLRKYFVAPKGSILLDADYSQIELRILAAISEDEQMMAAFKAGEDIHR
ncbi:MAG: DNA polymerase, partial [Pygmaiobacter sp.]